MAPPSNRPDSLARLPIFSSTMTPLEDDTLSARQLTASFTKASHGQGRRKVLYNKLGSVIQLSESSQSLLKVTYGVLDATGQENRSESRRGCRRLPAKRDRFRGRDEHFLGWRSLTATHDIVIGSDDENVDLFVSLAWLRTFEL